MKSSENKIYELLNKTKIDEDNYEAVDLSEFEEEKLMQNFQQSIKSEINSESLATNQTYTGDVQNNKSFNGKKQSKKTKLAVALAKVDKILDSEDVNIKIIDIVMDDSSITMNTLFDISGMAIDDTDDIEILSINKMKVILNGNETSIGVASGKDIWLDENVLNNIRTYSLKDKLEIKNDNNLKVIIEELDCIIDGKYSAIEYNKEFELNASKEELTGGGVQSSIDIVIPSEIGEFTIKNVVFQPLMQRIEIEKISSEKPEDLNLVVFVKTKDGKAEFFEHSCESSNGIDSMVLLYDDENSDLSIEELSEVKELDLELYVKNRKSETEIEYKKISEKQNIKLK